VTIVRLASTPSTQEIARDLEVGSAVVADHQTAGRGRLGRTWEAPPGTALLASFVMPARPLASLAAGVAAAHACGLSSRLKWPNDVLLDGAKLAGVLAELRGDRVIVGIGINLTWAPPGAAMLGAGTDRDTLLDRLVAELQRWFAAPDGQVLAGWRERAETLGRTVRVELPGESFEGLAEDVAVDGSLIVSGRLVAAGDVIHVR
jgi:BirA family biotin operon repressor/biotin-[acetyl-CoA-carboxylase] ligase